MENEIIPVPATTTPNEKGHVHRESDTHVKLNASVFGNHVSFFAKRHVISDAEVTHEKSCCLPWFGH